MTRLGCDRSMFINPAKCLAQKALEVLDEINLKNDIAGSVKYFVSANRFFYKRSRKKV